MIKTSYATFISAICMIFITWFFSKSMENTWAENKVLKERISELETRYTNKISYNVIKVSGSFEIPLAISKNIKKFDGFIALGCIIKGQTTHNQLISQAIFNGLINLMIKNNKPIANAILTTDSTSQAKQRIKKKSLEAVKAIKSFI